MMIPLLFACASTPQLESAPLMEIESAIPQPGPLPSWSPPSPLVGSMENGSTLWVLPDNSLPLVSLRIVFPGGAATDPSEAPGAAYMAGLLMEEGAGELDSMQMTRAFELLAASASIDVETQAVIASLDVAADRFDEAYALLADTLIRPRLQRDDYTRIQGQHVLGLEEAMESGSSLASTIARREHFGDSPYARTVGGTPEGIRSLSYESVKAAYLRLVRPGGAIFVVVGDVDPGEIGGRLMRPLDDWEGVLEPPLEVATSQGATGLFVVNDTGASQTAIRVMGKGPKAGHVDRLAASAAAVVIGGSFTSRLNYLLREQKGYTYGASARFNTERDFGYLSASSNVRADATVDALQDMLGVFVSAGEGFSEEDVNKARSQIFTDQVDNAASRSDLADFFAERAGDGLRPDGWAKELELAMSSTSVDMQGMGQRFMDPASLTVVLAGDFETMLPALDAAGLQYTVTEPTP